VGVKDCTGAANQQWTVNVDGTVVGMQSGRCLDATGQGTVNGTLLDIWTCNGGANQKWARAGTGGILKGLASGKCVDLPAANQANGVRPALWSCNGGSNQDWTSTESNQLIVLGNNCLDVTGHGTGDGLPWRSGTAPAPPISSGPSAVTAPWSASNRANVSASSTRAPVTARYWRSGRATATQARSGPEPDRNQDHRSPTLTLPGVVGLGRRSHLLAHGRCQLSTAWSRSSARPGPAG